MEILKMLPTVEFQDILQFLNCPFIPNIDIDDRKSQVVLVLWLEDVKIRSLDISHRTLMHSERMLDSNELLNNYLTSLDSPFSFGEDSNCDCIMWLLNYAVNLEYENEADNLGDLEDIVASTSFDIHLFNEALNRIYCTLFMSEDRRRFNVVKIFEGFLESIFSKLKLLNAPLALWERRSVEIQELLKQLPSSIQIDDDVVNKLLVILRVLHTQDLKDLQTDINHLIVIGQNFTANPKTNTKMGKVGY